MIYILWILVAMLIVYLGLCLFYYFFQNRLIFVRYDIKGKYRFKLEKEHEEILLKSEEGETLHGLWMKTPNPKGLIIYFHGNTGSLKRWGKIAAKLTEFGYDVLAPDYRGYGKSTGKPSEFNLIKDAHIFYDFACEHYKEKEIVIYGRSLGSAVAVQLAATKQAKLLILETPFASLYDVVNAILYFIPFRLLLKYPFKSIDHIDQVRSKIIIMAGMKDSQVPFKSSQKLYNKVADRKDVYFHSFDRGEHNTLSSFKKYHQIMEDALR
jgi:fermentation-respiration switch protein FrsA (DUF1100 family)